MNKSIDENIYNENVYLEERRIIQDAESRNKLVVFVGAGISIPAGLPSWAEAIEEIQSKLGEGFQESDFLKVPQYYYNEHGKNNYTALMRKVFKFGKKLYPRPIHRKILDFRTQYIITTNYDTLLENAAIERNVIMDIIACDKDISYGIAGKKLIKMHGDFEHDNFVLKEDDYLRYSMNFRLIETYIKALIAGNIVLFIGYSFNDPDLKQIFVWVKEILGNDMPQSYIIEINEDFSSAKVDYFRNYGIKILYASEKIKNFQRDYREKNTEKMLDFLQTKTESISKLDGVYQYLKPFKNMNYICNKYIKLALQNQKMSVSFNDIKPTDIESSKLLKNIVKSNKSRNTRQNNHKKNQQERKVSDILSILRKSSISEIITQIPQENSKETLKVEKLTSLLSDNTKKMIKAIFHYDIDALRRIRDENENIISEDHPHIYLEQAFLSYYLQEYKEAHQYLKIGSRVSYHSDMYEWYFISLLNRKCLVEIVRHDNFGILPSPEKDWKESLDIDLEKIFLSLPDLGNEHNRFLRDLYTFQLFYTLFTDVYHQAKKVEEEASTKYFLYIGTPKFIPLEEQLKDIWWYINSNYLLLDRYREYIDIFHIYGKQILESALAPNMSDEDDNDVFGLSRSLGSVRPKVISVFSLYVIIQYMPLNEIKKVVFNSGNKTIPIGDNGRDYLLKIIPNIAKMEKNKNEELFWKILYISYHTELTESLILSIVKTLKNFVWPNIRRYSHEISGFFYYAEQYYEEKNDIANSDELLDILHQFIEDILSDLNITNTDRTIMKNICGILYASLSLYKKLYGVFDSPVLSNLMTNDYAEIMGYIYPLLGKPKQKSVRKIVSRKKWDMNTVNIGIVRTFLRNKVITIDESLEHNILNYISNLDDDRTTTKPSKYEMGIQEVACLYVEDSLKHKESFYGIIKESGVAFAEWLIDTENFDYDKFDPEWLDCCSQNFLINLKKNKRAVQCIRRQAKEKYLKGFVNDSFIRIYFKYFAV